MQPGWLSRHRWPLVAAAVLLAYALAGFVLAPWLLGRQVVELARERLGREASVGAIEVNPFAFSLRVHDLRLKDVDGSPLIGLDELRVNLAATASLFGRAWTFSELTVSGPYLKLVRDHAGSLNLRRLLPPAEPAAAEQPGLPRLVVRRLQVDRGVIDVTDEVPATAFHTRIGPFGVAIEELSTLPKTVGEQEVAVTLESGTQLRLAGDFSLEPLRLAGRISLKGPFLGWASRYLGDQLRFTVAGGDADLAARYAVTSQPDGRIGVAVDDLVLGVSGLRLTAAGAPDFLGWTRLQVTGGALRWPEVSASATSLVLEGLRVHARRGKAGDIDLAMLLTPARPAGAAAPASASAPVAAAAAPAAAPAPAPTPAPATAPAPATPRLRLDAFSLRDAAIELVDAAPATDVTWSVTGLDVSLREVSNEPGARFPLEASAALGSGGKLGLTGSVGVLPALQLDADLKAEGIALAQAQPYLADLARIELRGGTLGLEGHLAVDGAEALAFDGDLRIRELDSFDTRENAPLLAWQELSLDDIGLRLTGRSVRVAQLRLAHPFARIFINRDQTTNLGALRVEAPPAAGPAAPVAAPAASPGPAQRPFHAHIGKVLVTQGEVDYTDLSLPLPFAARVQELKGEFTTIDSQSNQPAKIALEGRVAPYGLARVSGQLRVSAPTELADIGVLFRNIEMAPLSPYTVKFAGRKIARGKIDLDLHYRLDHRRLAGTNKVVIDELELGEKVPNPEAADLPLGLAVALLKDANGRIDLDMPVEGSLDDPQFRIGGVLWKAFVNLVTRAVSAPFRLLGGLLGIQSEDLGRIDFTPGRADLLPPGREKLARVAEALAKRPGLAVEVPAVVAPAADTEALRTEQTAQRIEAALAASGAPATGRKLEKRTREVVEMLYTARFPDRRLADVQAAHTTAPAGEPQGRARLDELAYVDALRGELAQGEVVDDAALAALAGARAAAISAELTGALQVPAARVRSGAREDVQLRDGEWVPAQIGVAGAGD